jgi:hypothetical protein
VWSAGIVLVRRRLDAEQDNGGGNLRALRVDSRHQIRRRRDD